MGEGKKDKVKREFSAGGVVFKKKDGQTLWLLINPASSDVWQLPKGHIDGDESSEKTAVREVLEETSTEAKPIAKVDIMKYFFWKDGKRILKSVTFYLMEYVNGGKKKPDMEIGEAGFYPYTKALKMLSFESEKEILRKASSLV